jgi:hypothetical protein
LTRPTPFRRQRAWSAFGDAGEHLSLPGIADNARPGGVIKYFGGTAEHGDIGTHGPGKHGGHFSRPAGTDGPGLHAQCVFGKQAVTPAQRVGAAASGLNPAEIFSPRSSLTMIAGTIIVANIDAAAAAGTSVGVMG